MHRLNIKDAVFCSPSCFKDNCASLNRFLSCLQRASSTAHHTSRAVADPNAADSKHKKLHTRLAVPATSSVDYAPGSASLVL